MSWSLELSWQVAIRPLLFFWPKGFVDQTAEYIFWQYAHLFGRLFHLLCDFSNHFVHSSPPIEGARPLFNVFVHMALVYLPFASAHQFRMCMAKSPPEHQMTLCCLCFDV